jgi:hypothetical protein
MSLQGTRGTYGTGAEQGHEDDSNQGGEGRDLGGEGREVLMGQHYSNERQVQLVSGYQPSTCICASTHGTHGTDPFHMKVDQLPKGAGTSGDGCQGTP